MTFAYWTVLAAALLPYVAIVLAKSHKGYDNRAPRLQLAQSTGWRQRAWWAHQNGFEAFPPFAAAVVIAQLAHAPQPRVDWLAGVFIAARVCHLAAYLTDRPAARSLSFFAGLAAVIGLFCVAA